MKKINDIIKGRYTALAVVFILVAVSCGCGCYPYGFDDMIGDDFGAELEEIPMASLMEKSPSGLSSPVAVGMGGGSPVLAHEYVPRPPSFGERFFVYIDDPFGEDDGDGFEDLLTGPFGFICDDALVPPEIFSPGWDETVYDNTPTIFWTEAYGGYEPYSYWVLCDDDPFFGSPEIDEYVGHDLFYTIPEGTYGCGTTVFISLICFDGEFNPAYAEVVVFHYPPCDWTGDESGTIGSGIGETIIGGGGVVDGGIVGIVDIGHWLSETAVISIPFSDMLTGLTRDDGSRIGALFSFAVPRYVILVKIFILFLILLLLRRKKKEKGAGKKKKIDKSIKR
jgi:hypothetical protein